jgi:hypothetical protein
MCRCAFVGRNSLNLDSPMRFGTKRLFAFFSELRRIWRPYIRWSASRTERSPFICVSDKLCLQMRALSRLLAEGYNLW